MQLVKVIGTGALAMCVADCAYGAYPPLDRPTPPPCCADGIGYPNVPTWGWYGTRWRRWPTDLGESAVTPAAPSEKFGPDIKPFETPAAEDEDRRAPPPTQPKAEEEKEGTEPGPEAPPPAIPPAAPTTPSPDRGFLTPPTAPVIPPGRMPWEETTPPGPAPNGGLESPPTTPLTPPPGRMPWEETSEQPTGDLDPPPSLPSIVTVGAKRALVPQAPESARQQQPPAAPRQIAPTDDPPPKPPVVLASTRRL
jgi:hypothetical protein